MQIYDTNYNFKILLNKNETLYYFGKFGSKLNKNALKKRLNIILKKALIKSNRYVTCKIVLKQINRTKHKGCEIIYAKLTHYTVKQTKTVMYLKTTTNCKELFNTIEEILQANIKNSTLFLYNKKYYLICEAEQLPKNFKQTSVYTKPYLEEYAKLLSENAIKDIGRIIKNS